MHTDKIFVAVSEIKKYGIKSLRIRHKNFSRAAKFSGYNGKEKQIH
jgi:hypothetical protein